MKKVKRKKGPTTHKPGQSQAKVLAAIIIFALALYGNTIGHGYAYDDGIVITENEFTRQGISGIDDIFKHDSFYGVPNLRGENLVKGGRYRPLSIATFAIEYQFLGENPGFSHLVNILILILTTILIYKLTSQYFFPSPTRRWYLSVAFLASMLFLAHPLHTETVANIKGRDELLCLLFGLLAMWFAFRYQSSKKHSHLFLVFINMLLALLSKESAITFFAAIPLTLWFFTTERRVLHFLIQLAPLFAASALFLFIRSLVLPPFATEIIPDLMNDSFIEATTIQKYATIVFTFGLYLKLLFFPHPLTYDYYPYHIGLKEWHEPMVILSFTAWSVLAFLAVTGFRKKSPVSFATLFFLITISVVSNIPFPVGAFMSERFLYIPSLAFCLLMAWLFNKLTTTISTHRLPYAHAMLVLVFVLLSVKTISRNQVWESNLTLFSTDVVTSSESLKSNHDYAIAIANQADNTLILAEKKKLYEEALRHLRKILNIYPAHQSALVSYADISFKYSGNADTTIHYYEKALEINPNTKKIYNTLGTLYGQFKSDYDKAISYFLKDIELNNGTADTYKKLSMCYLFSGDSAQALANIKRGLELSPYDGELKTLNELLMKNQ